MISIYKIKPKFQQLLKPVLIWLHKKRVTANQITISSIILSIGIGICFWYADRNPFLFLALPVGLLIRMALNALDGMMARTYNQQSLKGEILNEAGDILSDVVIYYPLVKYHPALHGGIIILIIFSVANELAGIAGRFTDGRRRYDGPMGKSDRAFLMGIYGICSFVGIGLGDNAKYGFAVVAVLLTISTEARLRKSYKKI
jgi:CDP-diacylglycerol--glycerol-3-phosphate 3-phosphatidyltransferase